MKLKIIALLLASAGMAAQAAEPGSIDAAMDIVPTTLGKVHTLIEKAEFTGDQARIQARMLQLTCNFLMKRDEAAADKSGWRVETFDCKQIAD